MQNRNVKINWFIIRTSYIFVIITLLYCIGCYDKKLTAFPHNGENSSFFTIKQFDTIYIDGSVTSLNGEWHTNGSSIFYNDYLITGLIEFDTLGNYIENRIKHGRASNEWVIPFAAAVFDDSLLYSIDLSWNLHSYDKQFNKTTRPIPMLHDIPYSNSDWNNLLHNPDVEEPRMYEYNLDSRNISIYNGKLVLPIITTHVKFNGFYIDAHSESFWKTSYILMEVNKDDFSTLKLFGQYPYIYSTKNIPVFSNYSFDILNDELIVSFNADSLIYCYNKDGVMTNTFGYSASNIKDNYPETYTYEDFQKLRKEHLKDYGYYLHLKVIGNYIFRTYKSAGENSYGIQIYHGKDLIGDVKTTQEAYVFGEIDGVYYAALPADIDNDCYKLLKFRLPND